jgi:hypothetical protein
VTPNGCVIVRGECDLERCERGIGHWSKSMSALRATSEGHARVGPPLRGSPPTLSGGAAAPRQSRASRGPRPRKSDHPGELDA